MIDATHDPQLRSWVESANAEGTDFPIQKLPYARFRRAGSSEVWRIGVAVGDRVLDFGQALDAVAWPADVAALMGPLASGDLNTLMGQPIGVRRALRAALSSALAHRSDLRSALHSCLLRQADVEYSLPCQIGDFSDFYTGIHHARAVGKLFPPDNPLLRTIGGCRSRITGAPRPSVSAASGSAGRTGRSKEKARRRTSAPAAGSTTSSNWAS